MQKKILVVGGTGRLGQPVARRLKEDGYQVRVLARDVEKAKKLFDESFEIVQGDVTDTNSLERALDGCHGVHISLNESMEQIGGGNVSAAAAKQRLERITYISGAPLTEEYKSYSFVRGKLAAEKAIRTHFSGWRLIYCSQSQSLELGDGDWESRYYGIITYLGQKVQGSS